VTTNYRLVYHSLNRIVGTDEQVQAEINGILAASRTNNSKVGVTGALMFNSGYFAQVLEGAQGAIEATFERIQRDERHGAVTLLEFSPVEGRGFSNWSMAFIGSSAAHSARFGDLAKTTGFDPGRLSGEALFRSIHDVLMSEDFAAA